MGQVPVLPEPSADGTYTHCQGHCVHPGAHSRHSVNSRTASPSAVQLNTTSQQPGGQEGERTNSLREGRRRKCQVNWLVYSFFFNRCPRENSVVPEHPSQQGGEKGKEVKKPKTARRQRKSPPVHFATEILPPQVPSLTPFLRSSISVALDPQKEEGKEPRAPGKISTQTDPSGDPKVGAPQTGPAKPK